MFRLANPLWGFALFVKVMAAKRFGFEAVTNTFVWKTKWMGQHTGERHFRKKSVLIP